MSKGKISIIIWVVGIILIIIWSINGILNIRKMKEPYSVSVIVDDSFNDRWLVARKGLEQAAEENNIVMNYVYTNKYETANQQMEVISREIANGADGIIIQWISSDVKVEELTNVMKDKALVMLETDIAAEGLFHVCSVNNYEFGRAAAEQIVQGISEKNGIRVGVLAGDENLVSTDEQLKGARSVFEEEGIEEAWIVYNNGQDDKETVGEKLSGQKADAVLFLGSTQTELGIDCLEKYEMLKAEEAKRYGRKQAEIGIAAYGSGYSKKNVYYLDKQVLNSLVVSDEFNLGYQAMLALTEQLKYHANEFRKTEIGFKVVACEQMHEEDNEKLLFPIVQ